MEANQSLEDGDDQDIQSLLTEVVCEEDKLLITDVIGIIKVCREPDRLCTSWTVSPMDGTGYTMIAYLPRAVNQGHVEVTHDDINMIECVNPMRVRVGVVQFPQGTWALKVKITSHTAPISFTTYDAVRVNVRKSILNNTGSWLGSLFGAGKSPKKRQRTASGGGI